MPFETDVPVEVDPKNPSTQPLARRPDERKAGTSHLTQGPNTDEATLKDGVPVTDEVAD